MRVFQIIIIILVLFCLFILTFKFVSYKLNGGEYLNCYYVENNKTININPTVSQLVIYNEKYDIKPYFNDEISYEEKVRKLDEFIDRCVKFNRKQATIYYNDRELRISSLSTARLISDANIDLLGTILLNNGGFIVKNGFGICEWHGDSKYGERSEIFTIYDGDISYLTSNKCYDKDKNIFIYEEPIKSLIETNKKLSIYLEFSYKDGEKFENLYKKIHKRTCELINEIINEIELEDDDEKVICFIRLVVQEDGEISRLEFEPSRRENRYVMRRGDGKRMLIIGFDKSNFNTVVVPATKSEFSYDEEINLYIEKNGRRYVIDLQIEHSEGEESHKSNLVEFIGRNVSQYASSPEDIRRCFRKLTNYNFKNNCFVCSLSSKKSISESTIYKSFGRFAKSLF